MSYYAHISYHYEEGKWSHDNLPSFPTIDEAKASADKWFEDGYGHVSAEIINESNDDTVMSATPTNNGWDWTEEG